MSEDNKNYWDEIEERLKRIELERQREKEAFAAERERRRSKRKGRSQNNDADLELIRQYEEARQNTSSKSFLNDLEKGLEKEDSPSASKSRKEPSHREKASLEDKEVEKTLAKLWDDREAQLKEESQRDQKEKKLSNLFKRFKKDHDAESKAAEYQTAASASIDDTEEKEPLFLEEEPKYKEKARRRQTESSPTGKPQNKSLTAEQYPDSRDEKVKVPQSVKTGEQETLTPEERLRRAEEIEKRWTQKLNLKDLEAAQQKIDQDIETARYQLSAKPTFKKQEPPAEPTPPKTAKPSRQERKRTPEPWPQPAPGVIPPEPEIEPGIDSTPGEKASIHQTEVLLAEEERLKRAEEIEKRWTQKLTLEDIQAADIQRKTGQVQELAEKVVADRKKLEPETGTAQITSAETETSLDTLQPKGRVSSKAKEEPIIPATVPEKLVNQERQVKKSQPEEDEDLWMFKTPPEIKKETLVEEPVEEPIQMVWNVEPPKKPEEPKPEPEEFRWTTEPEEKAGPVDEADEELRLKQAEEIEKQWTQNLPLKEIAEAQEKWEAGMAAKKQAQEKPPEAAPEQRTVLEQRKQPEFSPEIPAEPVKKPASPVEKTASRPEPEPTKPEAPQRPKHYIPTKEEVAALKAVKEPATPGAGAPAREASTDASARTAVSEPQAPEAEKTVPLDTTAARDVKPGGQEFTAERVQTREKRATKSRRKASEKSTRALARAKTGKLDKRLPFEKQMELRKEQFAIKKEIWGAKAAKRLAVLSRWEKRLSRRTAIAVQKLDIRIEKFLFFTDVVADKVENRFWDFLDYAENHKMRLLAAFGGLLVLAIGVTVFIGSITAYEYIYNGRVLGIVKDQDQVYTTIDVIGTKLGEAYETSIEIDKERDITFNTVRGLDLELDNQEEVLNKLTYMKDIKATGYAIYVEGEQVAVLQNYDVAQHVLDSITSRYVAYRDNVEYKSAPGFAENVDIAEVDILLGDIEREDEVLEYMLTGSVEKQIHLVQKGQTFSEIASLYQLRQDELLAMNPGIQPDKLQIGQEIILTSDSPIVTVQTVEVATYDMPIAFETTYQEDSSLYKDQTRTITAGITGYELIEAEIIRHNGMEVDRKIIQSSILSEPVNAVVAVGTKERPALVGTGSFAYPIRGARISSHFGSRWGRQHKGTDFAASTGTAIYAADGGTVTFAGYKGSFGYLVIINHGGGRETYYAHCSKLHVSSGQKVYKGQHIANVGNTGNSTGPHLHFEVHINGVARNPMNYL